MMMPRMDGIETCRAIRRNPELRHTIIVFLSALGEEEQQLAGFDVGADDYLTKPIKMKLLVSRIQAILKRIDNTAEHDAPAAREAITVDRERHTVRCGGEEIALPRKEFALLELLAQSPETSFRATRSMPGSGARTSWSATARSTSTSASCARKSVNNISLRSRASATNMSRNGPSGDLRCGSRPRLSRTRTTLCRNLVLPDCGPNNPSRQNSRKFGHET